MRRSVLFALVLLCSLSVGAQGINAVFPPQIVTASGQTDTLPIYGSAFSVGSITVTGTSLTTVTFAVMGSSDNGVSFYPLPITTVGSPGSTPTTTVTATAAGLYQVNLAGITHIEFVTSGTFTATSVKFVLSASPVGFLSSRDSGGGPPVYDSFLLVPPGTLYLLAVNRPIVLE
jgi:hypothetical protein